MKTSIKKIAAFSCVFAAFGLFAASDCGGCSAKEKSRCVKAEKCDRQLWTEDIEGAFKTAAAEKKQVFIDFTGSDWCYWCILADRNIFSTKEWADFSANMVCLKVDFPSKNKPDAATMSGRRAFAKEFGVRGYPTFILASPDRKQIARFSAGKKGAAEFIAEVKKALPR